MNPFLKPFAHVLLVMGLLITTQEHGLAQGAPQAVNYQGVLRRADGDAMANTRVAIRLSIVADTASTQTVYAELHETQTDDVGLFAVELGKGISASRFSAVPWGARQLWLRVDVDDDAGGPRPFLRLGQQEIVSVPYAIYAERTKKADTAVVVQGFALGLGVAYGTGDSLSYLTPAPQGYLLVSTGRAQPEWKPVSSIIDGSVIDSIITTIVRDTSFVRGLTDTVRLTLQRDTAFIKAVASDSTIRDVVTRLVDSTLRNRPVYRDFRDSLIGDREYIDTMTIVYGDRLSRDRRFLERIAKDSLVQSLIATDPRFTRFLFGSQTFRDSLGAAIRRTVENLDGPFWRTDGNDNVDPTKQFLGTRRQADLAIRTNNVERMRVTAGGAIGINTTTPTATLDINGTLNITRDLRVNGDPGSEGYILVSSGGGNAPRWQKQTSTLQNAVGGLLLEKGTTSVTISNVDVAATSNILLTIEDLDDTGFVFAQVVQKVPGSFRVRMSAPVVSGNTRLTFMIVNP